MKLAVLATVLLASSPAHADQEDPFDGGTITAQAGIGGISGLVGGAVMGLVGAGVGHLMNPRDIGMPLAGAVLGFATGAAIGVVWSVERWRVECRSEVETFVSKVREIGDRDGLVATWHSEQGWL